MKNTLSRHLILPAALAAMVCGSPAFADGRDDDGRNNRECDGLPNHSQLQAALKAAQGTANGGFGLNMWGTIVNRDGVVCAVAFTGSDRGAQWPGSRAISAQKANTANAFSLPGLALSTANLFTAVQPGGSLYGLQHSNPVDTDVAYGGTPRNYGQPNDPMVGKRIGGVNVFGGGLGLYKIKKDDTKELVGGLGVSGDSSCADHNIAWKTRHNLVVNQTEYFDHVPAGVSGQPSLKDNIVYDTTLTVPPDEAFASWGHPQCSSEATEVAGGLPANR